jgi:hypothetical protein
LCILERLKYIQNEQNQGDEEGNGCLALAMIPWIKVVVVEVPRVRKSLKDKLKVWM